MFFMVHTFRQLNSRHRWDSLTRFQLCHTDIYVVLDQCRSKISDDDSLEAGWVAKLIEIIVDAKLCVFLNGKSQNVVITDFVFESFNFSFPSWYAEINAIRSRQGLSCWHFILHRKSKSFQKSSSFLVFHSKFSSKSILKPHTRMESPFISDKSVKRQSSSLKKTALASGRLIIKQTFSWPKASRWIVTITCWSSSRRANTGQ